MHSMVNLSLRWLLLSSLFACTAQRKSGEQSINHLKFIGQFTLPHKMQFQGTTIGGLSSIDYSPDENEYYLICDDRSDINPARFYKARITLSDKAIDTVEITGVVFLKQADGSYYPNRKQDSLHTPDPEALRFHPGKKQVFWSSEGERIVDEKTSILLNPSINVADQDGRLVDTFILPSNLQMHKEPKGPRRNGVLEGLSFDPQFKKLFVSVEEPLYEDGPRAGLNDSIGWIRILCYDDKQGQPKQYAYQIDPVVNPPDTPGHFIVNGVPDILALNDHQLLVTERSFSTGHSNSNIRVYLADINDAENIAADRSLLLQPSGRPVKKRLLLNMNSLGIFINNIEGATFGPRLPNGKRSLIFVADDNFSSKEKNQFLLFEID